MDELNFKSPFKYAPWKPEPTMQIAEAQYDLHLAGYAWATNNNGVHLRVCNSNGHVVADVWPTTGKYSIRNGKSNSVKKVYNGNVTELIERLKK
jgi:hypothetical protein